MIITAGVFLIRGDGKVLICHPTKHRADSWSIPKGRTDPNETPFHAAIRETLEETNIDLTGVKFFHEIRPIPYPKGRKTLYSFAIFEKQNKIDFNSFELKCNSNVPEDIGGFPEMDDYKWVSIDEAKTLLHGTQVEALNRLEDTIKIMI